MCNMSWRAAEYVKLTLHLSHDMNDVTIIIITTAVYIL